MADILDPAQRADTAQLPPQPAAPPGATQANAAFNPLGPGFEAVAAQYPDLMAKQALNQRLNPASGPPPAALPPAAGMLARALPANGAPTPSFAPPLDGRISTLMEHGAHALAQGVFGGGPKDVAAAQQSLPAAPAPAPPWGHPDHAVANPHQYSEGEWVNATRGLTNMDLENMWQHVQKRSPAEVALAQLLNHAYAGATTPEGQQNYENLTRMIGAGSALGPLANSAMYNDAIGAMLARFLNPPPSGGMKPKTE